ncbi:hypothetical protein DV735_g5466, partial [Chaetothyriales sp. CBS 134920]
MEMSHSAYESITSFSHHLPFSYYDIQSIIATAPAAPSSSSSPPRARTYSAQSLPFAHPSEIPPALISTASNPSIPSASSSTVGSPCSGPIHMPSHDEYKAAMSQSLGPGPTIVNQDSFDLPSSVFEPDFPIGHDKLNGNFVGECADSSSSQPQSSTLPAPICHRPPTAPRPLYDVSAYPEQLAASSALDASNAGSSASSSRASPRAASGHSDSDSVFKSPATPASTYPNATRTESPTISRAPVRRLSHPSLINGPIYPNTTMTTAAMHGTLQQPDAPVYQHPFSAMSPTTSPAPSPNLYQQTQFSPPVTFANYDQQLQYENRRPSASGSFYSSHASPTSEFEDGEKGRCPHPGCGRVFKDLKAHMLTHQAQRPEKCPILTCEYNQKGFARKYDKNRHTLTHYKGTMVCGFCPGSGSAAEKSFNRADVFKRHLTAVHGVEQTPPNSRKRSPSTSKKVTNYCQDATGKCSTCSSTFSNAQDFYEHLDDCVLRVVQQEEPSEAINAQHLGSMAQDNAKVVIGGGIQKSKSGKKGLTWSKGGVALVGKGRKKRKHYPPSWGMSAEKMQMKKRVLCVYDGERRLWKDDMMLHNQFEVRMKLPDGKSYVTDLDVETMKRAEAFHSATEAEKGPWMADDMSPEVDLNELMQFKAEQAQLHF